jgi:prevent-host-death family protein
MIGIRELRGDLAAHVRRAAAGQPTIVSVAGHPAAVLGPVAIDDHSASTAHLSALVASAALVPPRRADGHLPDGIVAVFSNVRLDRLLREIRG